MAENNECNLVLEDIGKNAACMQSMSGVKRVIIALMDDIDTYPERINEASRQGLEDHVRLQGNIVMKAGKRAYKVYTDPDNAEMTYESQGEKGSKSKKAKLDIKIPGLRAKVLGFNAAIQNAELVILALLNNGEWHMMGDKDRGADLDDDKTTSGKGASASSGSELSFTYDTAIPQIYTGDIDSLLTEAPSGNGGGNTNGGTSGNTGGDNTGGNTNGGTNGGTSGNTDGDDNGGDDNGDDDNGDDNGDDDNGGDENGGDDNGGDDNGDDNGDEGVQ